LFLLKEYLCEYCKRDCTNVIGLNTNDSGFMLEYSEKTGIVTCVCIDCWPYTADERRQNVCRTFIKSK
jgi:hypothetical protein